MRVWIQFMLILLLLGSHLSQAQRSRLDSLAEVQINAPTAKDTAFGMKAKKIVPKKLYNFLFRDIYNRNDQGKQVNAIEENPFKIYEGRWIRHVYVTPLNVFGYSVYDSLSKPSNWLDRVGNNLHRATRERTVKNKFLFFEEGDLIDPEKLKDNERYLRQQGIFHDARIVIIPYRNAKDAVDVYVITQDIWSLIPDGSFSALDNFQIGLEQRNFRGLGNSFRNELNYNGQDPRQKLEYASRYLIPSFDKSFISGAGEVFLQRERKIVALKVFRSFLRPETKYAGALEVSYNNIRTFDFKIDSLTNRSVRNYYWSRYFLFDAWIGRSFKLFFGSDQLRQRARFVMALRHSQQTFFKRERTVTDTSNQILQNIKPTLFSIGFSNRRYRRDLLIYGFGRTEDVPVGESFSVIYGNDRAELGQRTYTGLKFSRARYYPVGYFYTLLNLGSYWKNGASEQGIFSLENNYFSPLLPLGKRWYGRQFVNLRFGYGINRFEGEYLNISGQEGIQGISSDELRGTRKLVLGFESVLFSPVNLLGFRIAPFVFTDLGWSSYNQKPFFAGVPYQAYGVGFRFRNENLTFDTFQVRFSFYSGIPDISPPFRMGFDGIAPLRFRDFDISAPEVVPFR
ncbi:MAG: hypothetical protein EAZ14_00425 [Runella slithyformis]|nr:MAG: hypothetical protein EAZ38_17055 [Cytophagales bacterium]TAG36624.1 MAG: hypothetical protein EAZ32_16610 [Cytophagia bacterium]TAG78201.1 MAG: hypothetical protein EAZ22_14095 [Cytophagales bacterium]TAH16586.1 MAG: hypothetical protein EAZ14_00425 [Runella slithyformis]